MSAKVNAGHDESSYPTLTALSSVDLKTIVPLVADPTTHRLLADLTGGIAGILQTDTFTATNNQTIFTASQSTVAYTLYLALNGAIQTPSSDYSVSGNVATLSSGVPSGTIVVWLYSIA